MNLLHNSRSARSHRIAKLLTFPAFTGLLSVNLAAGQSDINPEIAARHFSEAQEISQRDGGRLWGTNFYGPMLLREPDTHSAVANQADAEGRLAAQGKVFVGKLPPDVIVANTSIDWAGVHWTMIVWPLPEEPSARARLMMHESFHRIQDKLGLKAASPACSHLESKDGRIWLQLEWRALETALEEHGDKRKQALEDALLFRSYRNSLFPKGGDEERGLELNEGLAEYTGVKLSTRSLSEMTVVAACGLRQARGRQNLARSFAYVSGPAYGALLDSSGANWRTALKGDTSFTSAVQKAYALRPTRVSEREARRRASAYEGDYVIATETEHEKIRRDQIAKYRAKFLEGPILTFPIGKTFSYGFDPNQVVPLDDSNTVYLSARVTDDWGTLDGPGGVLIVRQGGTIVRLQVGAPADASARPLKGDGWTLAPAKGWTVIPGSRGGDCELRQEPEPR